MFSSLHLTLFEKIKVRIVFVTAVIGRKVLQLTSLAVVPSTQRIPQS